MDIYITGNLPQKENDTGQSVKLQMPALPSFIKYKCGAKMAEYNILDKGPVFVPNGNEITEYQWEGFLPGESHKNQPWIRGKWISPKTIENYFSVWKSNGVKLKLLITGTPINSYVYLKDYEISFSGPHGDYYYSLVFVSAIDIKVSYTKVTKPTPQRETNTSGRTHTIKEGDTLWDIAIKYYGKGTEYPKIYEANKEVIDNEAKKRGMPTGGRWIFAGTVLVIP